MKNYVAGQLRDIHGPDPVGWWPVAPGWWLALGALLAALLAWRLIERRRRRVFKDWRMDARRRLQRLARRVGKDDPKVIAGELSELLRRIAMARYGRNACAGLAGDAWLAWLRDHDPSGFDWTEQGRRLLDLPYAPAGGAVPAKLLQTLIKAAKRLALGAPPPRSRKRRGKRRQARARLAARRTEAAA